jgi:hypothetical protein
MYDKPRKRSKKEGKHSQRKKGRARKTDKPFVPTVFRKDRHTPKWKTYYGDSPGVPIMPNVRKRWEGEERPPC